MLIYGVPKNKDEYMAIDSNYSIKMHENGFMPKYSYNKKYYYLKTNELVKFMEKGVLN